jgi:hypothetical protein
MSSAGGACRLSIEQQDDGGLWLSVGSQHMTHALAHSRQLGAATGTGWLDASEFVAVEQLSLELRVGATTSLAIVEQGIVATAARSVRIL